MVSDSVALKKLIIAIFFCVNLFFLMAQDVGYFDFSDWALVNTDIKDLDGTWEFFPGEFISPGEMNLIPLALEVPGGWKDHQEAWGYGSYRCRFVLPDEFIDISMQLEGIQSCYKIFLNEELIAQVGTLGKSLEDEQPGGRWGYIPLYQLQRENELIIQVSNFQERNGGIFSSILIGPTEKMRTREMKYLFLRSIIVGIFFSLGIYHLILFAFRSKERTALYFGLFSLILALRVIFVESAYLISCFDFISQMSWQAMRRIEYLTFYPLAMVFNQYFYHLFPDYVDLRYGRIVNFIGIPYIFLVLFFPLRIYVFFLAFSQIIVLLWCFYCIYVLIRLTKREIWEAQVLVVAMTIFVGLIVVDMLASQNIIANITVTPIGFILFLMAQSTILSRRLVSSLFSVEHLSEELNVLLEERKRYQGLLEQRVEERTSELELAVEEAKAANQAKGDFLARMSHEIRTPLNGIIGFAEIVKDSRDMAEAKENTSVIISESEKLLILINQLLDLSRIEAGGLHLDRTVFSLSEVVESISNMFKPMVENKGIEFSILFDDPHPSTLIGDAFRIRQILINLLGNAVKFTQKGKVELRISCNYQSTRKKGYLFVVEDTGKGIAMDKLDNIFDSFVQEDTSITREYGGSGLGTAISKSFVELMDGRIGVESVEGEGTSFWFQVDFPLSKESLNVKSNITREDILELFTGSRILLAEDYLANQEVIKRYLRDTGTELVIAADGSEACNILDKQKFDLILLDIHMPNKNGYEVAQYIRKQLNSPMVIVGLTADGYQQVQERCKEVGMDDFLTKPIRKHTLLDTLGKWLRPQT